MSIWPLVLLLFHETILFADGKCLASSKDVRRNFFHYRDSVEVITIETSDRLTHNITSNIFKIYLEDILGYDDVKLVIGDSFNATSALDNVFETETHDDKLLPPKALINLEVWVGPDFSVPRNPKVFEMGVIAPPGRFGWFVSKYANVSWQTFLEPGSSSTFSINHDDFKLILPLAVDSNTRNHCSTSDCSNGTFTPHWCRKSPCATLLAGSYDTTATNVINIIKGHRMFVRVVWLGSNLTKGLKNLLERRVGPLLVLSWYPGEPDALDEWYPVAFPPCYKDELAPGCEYEARRLVKLASGRLREGAPRVFEAISEIYFVRDSYLELIRMAVKNPGASHYDIACNWMKRYRNETEWTYATNEKPVLEILGLFPLTSERFGANGLALAAEMAIKAINENKVILPDHKLIITNHDGNCSAQGVMSTFINYMLQSNAKQLIGILGPPCSDAVEPLVGLTKYFRTVVISYSAEGATFSDHKHNEYFFRTIGENQAYKHVYVLLFQKLKWKRLAAVTEEDQKYSEYITQLQELLPRQNMTFIHQRKVTSGSPRSILEDFRSRGVKVLIADIYDHSARRLMCEAYKMKMTQRQGYVWFLPQLLSENWYKVNSTREDSKFDASFNCSVDNMIEAIQGHFVIGHQALAPNKTITHEKISVKEWHEQYTKSAKEIGKENASVFFPISPYAGYAYDAVWTYALALNAMYTANRSFLADIHSKAAAEEFVEKIRQTNFTGVSGNIQFLDGPSRLTELNILQWKTNQYEIIGHVVAQVSQDNNKVENYKLDLFEGKIKWFTENELIPSDGDDSCLFQSLVNLLGVDCSGAIIVVNIVGFGLLALFLVLAVIITKHRYDKKVQKFEITEKYMKSMGFDLLASNLSDMDKWEISREWVVINRCLGEGAFGKVYGGEAYFEDRGGWVSAAVKTLKVNSTTEQKLDFLSEAEVMKRFDHKNIVKLLGVCTRSEPVYTVMEFMLYGDLKTFLLNRRDLVNNRRLPEEKNQVSSKKLTSMALDIARGLSYLASMKYVHRDMACRNCLLDINKVAKIGDFGLTRPMYENDYYKFSRKGMLPIRWMAPESLRDGLFTPSSDVWAFGVVLYEIVTFGSYPFQGLSNNQVIDYVKAGNTIGIPKEVKTQLESLIKSCWNLDYKKRPTASEIVEFLANNPRLLSPCLDVPASSVAVDDSEGLDLAFPNRTSVPPSPLESNSFFAENSHTLGPATAAELGECTTPPASPTENSGSISFFPDSARELLLPARRPVQIAMAPLVARIPSNRDLQSGSNV